MEAYIIGVSYDNDKLRVLDLSTSAIVRLHDYNIMDIAEHVRMNDNNKAMLVKDKLDLSECKTAHDIERKLGSLPAIHTKSKDELAFWYEYTQDLGRCREFFNLDNPDTGKKRKALKVEKNGIADYTVLCSDINGNLERLPLDEFAYNKDIKESSLGILLAKGVIFRNVKTSRGDIFQIKGLSIVPTKSYEQKVREVTAKIKMMHTSFDDKIYNGISKMAVNNVELNVLGYDLMELLEVVKLLKSKVDKSIDTSALGFSENPLDMRNTTQELMEVHEVKKVGERGGLVENMIVDTDSQGDLTAFFIYTKLLMALTENNRIRLTREEVDGLIVNRSNLEYNKTGVKWVWNEKNEDNYIIIVKTSRFCKKRTQNIRIATLLIVVDNKLVYEAAWKGNQALEEKLQNLSEQFISKAERDKKYDYGEKNIEKLMKSSKSLIFEKTFRRVDNCEVDIETMRTIDQNIRSLIVFLGNGVSMSMRTGDVFISQEAGVKDMKTPEEYKRYYAPRGAEYVDIVRTIGIQELKREDLRDCEDLIPEYDPEIHKLLKESS